MIQRCGVPALKPRAKKWEGRLLQKLDFEDSRTALPGGGVKKTKGACGWCWALQNQIKTSIRSFKCFVKTVVFPMIWQVLISPFYALHWCFGCPTIFSLAFGLLISVLVFAQIEDAKEMFNVDSEPVVDDRYTQEKGEHTLTRRTVVPNTEPNAKVEQTPVTPFPVPEGTHVPIVEPNDNFQTPPKSCAEPQVAQNEELVGRVRDLEKGFNARLEKIEVSDEANTDMARRITILEEKAAANVVNEDAKLFGSRLQKVEEQLQSILDMSSRMKDGEGNQTVDPVVAQEITRLVQDFNVIKEERSMDRKKLQSLELRVQNADAKQRELEVELHIAANRDRESLMKHATLMKQLTSRMDTMDENLQKLSEKFEETKTATDKNEEAGETASRDDRKARAELAQKFEETRLQLENDYKKFQTQVQEMISVQTPGTSGSQHVNLETINLLKERLDATRKQMYLLGKDKTGLTDWIDAVVSSSPTYYQSTFDHLYGFFGFELPYSPPSETIQIVSRAGDCWAMSGTKGHITYLLIKPVHLTKISLEHIHKDITHNQGSTPRDIQIFGQQVGRSDWENLGKFVYKVNDEPIQFFDIEYDDGLKKGTPAPSEEIEKRQGPYYTQVQVEFNSNYGNSDFTCIYRIRAHGEPRENSAK